MSDKPATLTLHELAARLGYDHRTVAALIDQGKGPGIRVGRRYLIFEAWVERFEQGLDGFWSHAIAGAPQPEPRPVDSPFVRRIA
jgi:excisionase family DNA binding protein